MIQLHQLGLIARVGHYHPPPHRTRTRPQALGGTGEGSKGGRAARPHTNTTKDKWGRGRPSTKGIPSPNIMGGPLKYQARFSFLFVLKLPGVRPMQTRTGGLTPQPQPDARRRLNPPPGLGGEVGLHYHSTRPPAADRPEPFVPVRPPPTWQPHRLTEALCSGSQCPSTGPRGSRG